MVVTARVHFYTYGEYRALEEGSPIRHEFVDGEIYAMAGATTDHALLSLAVGALIRGLLPQGCRAYSSDLRIRIMPGDATVYPDVTVVYGKAIHASDDAMAVTNPKLVVEVTSPLTERWDRAGKLALYQGMASVHEVLIVAHDAVRLEVHRRVGNDWATDVATAGQQLRLDSIGATLDVQAVYADLEGR